MKKLWLVLVGLAVLYLIIWAAMKGGGPKVAPPSVGGSGVKSLEDSAANAANNATTQTERKATDAAKDAANDAARQQVNELSH